ncbi:uncharacterized protein LOC135204397 [Macrobrachium nipponense]|uniref:uncharacterized protein LOC135204397 n=1 Tax=Macrobrachium nipponense TaxID=159736 RepID=UPI0030C8814A
MSESETEYLESDFDVKKFLSSLPGVAAFQSLCKRELVLIANYLDIGFTTDMKKDDLIKGLIAHLGIVEEKAEVSGVKESDSIEALKLRIKLKELDIAAERERVAAERVRAEERERERKLERERMEHELKLEEIKVRHRQGSGDFDVAKYMKMVPPFDENEVTNYFITFEKVAKGMGWPKTSWSILLQCALKGRAQEVFSSLSEETCGNYDELKKCILKAYELVPEAYRLKFRRLFKTGDQTYVDFARIKAKLLDDWLRSKEICDFKGFKQLILLEEFKNCLSKDLKVHLEELQVESLEKAAIMADEYSLTHKIFEGKNLVRSRSSKEGFQELKSGKSKTENASDLDKSVVAPVLKATESGKGRRGLVILRDTGALQSLILKRALPEGFEYEDKEKVSIKSFPKEIISCPYETVVLESDYATGPVRVAVVEEIPVEGVDLILANDIGGNRVLSNPRLLSYPQFCASTESLEGEFPGIFPVCAITRSMRKLEASRDSKIDFSKFFLGKFGDGSEQGKVLAVSREKFIKDQENDLELAEIAAKAFSDKEIENIPVGYYVENGLLMRKFRASKVAADEEWKVNYQIVVPPNYRPSILHLAHQNPFSGHFGINKTFYKLTKHFYWPGIHSDVKVFCKTCHVCQMIGKPNQKLTKAPLEPIPAMEEPFHRVIVDIVGPLPKSKGGNQYILTIMDRSTRYPEAIPLRNVCSKNIVNGMLQFFTRFGLPKEVQSDQGSNFLSNIFRQAMQELGIRQVTSSAYHPQSQGAVERYHQTLKTMLRKFCLENKSDWDKSLPFLLFASREIPNESLGFSPFELVFCHQVRGPLKLIKDQWINNVEDSNLLDYVSDSRERIRKTWDIARDNLMEAQQKMKKYYDLGAKKVDYKPGDEVLVFLPVAGQPLHAKFSGPYIIEKKVGNTDYVVLTPDRRRKKRLCHVNMLKPYFSRTPKPVL